MRYDLLQKPDFTLLRIVFDAPGEQMLAESSAMVARDHAVDMKTQMRGGLLSAAKRKLLGGESIAAYGGIHAVDVGPAGYVCDTSHIVGFTGGLSYDVRKVGGLKSLFFSGEGLVCHFHGHGRLWISTRNPGGLVSFLQPFRSVSRSN
jgi:uncharacterized protein (AIM24 family)